MAQQDIRGQKGEIGPPKSSEDCWKKVGIAGDRTCPELKKLGHCRNCHRYSEIGGRMLDREPPEGYLEAWGALLAKEKTEEVRDTISVVVFRIGAEWLALTTSVFREVTDVRRIHSIPHRDNNILLGLVSVRGEIQLCVSLANLLGVDKAEAPRSAERRRLYPRLIVVEKGGDRWVFAVDELHGIHRLHPGKIRNVPATVMDGKASFTKGIFEWERNGVAYLDEELVFSALRRSIS